MSLIGEHRLHLHSENRRFERVIEAEFENIEPVKNFFAH